MSKIDPATMTATRVATRAFVETHYPERKDLFEDVWEIFQGMTAASGGRRVTPAAIRDWFRAAPGGVNAIAETERDWEMPLAALAAASAIIEVHSRRIRDEPGIRRVVEEYTRFFEERLEVRISTGEALANFCLELCHRNLKAEADQSPLLVLGFHTIPQVTIGARRADSIEHQDSKFALLVRLAAQVKAKRNDGYCHDENDLYMTTGRQELYTLTRDLANLGLGARPIRPGTKGMKQHRLELTPDRIEIERSILQFHSRAFEKLESAMAYVLRPDETGEEDRADQVQDPFNRRWGGAALTHLKTVCRQYVLVSAATKIVFQSKQLVIPSREADYLCQQFRSLREPRRAHAHGASDLDPYVESFIREL